MILRNIYYRVKPYIPGGVRLAMRRAFARQVRKRSEGIWPIDESAGSTPKGWTGWPDRKRFAFVITHDVEGMKGLNRTRSLAGLEMELGFRSSFNFVPEGEYRVPDTLREFLESNGFEVGIHDLHHDGSLYASWDQFRHSAQTINRYIKEWEVVGFRSGFMRHDLQWLDEVDVLYDSSTFDTDPFEPQPDGVMTIFPFWVSKNGQSGYVEIPSTLPQDSTLFRILQETSIDLWKQKLDWVAQQGGLALVIIHPDYISFNGQALDGEYRQELIREFLGYVRTRYEQDCWFALPREVAHHVYNTMVPASSVNRRIGEKRKTVGRGSGMIAVQERPASGSGAVAPSNLETEEFPLQGKRMVSVSFSPFPGDPRPRRAAETFAAAGMLVDVICLAEDGRPTKESFKGGMVDRISIQKRRGSKLAYFWQYAAFIGIVFLKLAGRSMTKRYDIIHIHNMPDILVFSTLFPKIFGSRVMLDLHDPMPELMMTIFNLERDSSAVRWMTRLEKWSIAFADKVITVNRACEKLFTARSCDSGKVGVIMNAPDERIFHYVPARVQKRTVEKRQAPFVMMYHGTIVERNGLDLAVNALEIVQRSVPEAELRIYGPRTPFLDRVMETVFTKGLDKAVQFLGPRRLEELVHVIEECDVGVIPNKRSIFTEINTPTRIFEYLALGKPVVAPRAPGIQDYFDEDSLVLFELGNAEDLARQLIWVAAHPQEAHETTIRGQSVYRDHTWRREQEKLVEIGANLVASDQRCQSNS